MQRSVADVPMFFVPVAGHHRVFVRPSAGQGVRARVLLRADEDRAAPAVWAGEGAMDPGPVVEAAVGGAAGLCQGDGDRIPVGPGVRRHPSHDWVAVAVRVCSVCGGPISKVNVSGMCRVCNPKFRSPDHSEKVSAGIRRRYATDPAYLDELRKRAKRLSDRPDVVERRTRKFIENRVWEAGWAAQTPEVRERARRSISAKALAWCPPHLREQYRQLRAKGVPREEAREAILAHEKAEIERLRRRMTEKK